MLSTSGTADSPRFSVIVPTFNRAPLIGETIESILAQTFPHFELLIVDDGSTDNTAEVVNRYATADARLRYLPKENAERAAARNYGIRHARGEYAVFFDSDDWMGINHLSTLNEYIGRLPAENRALLATKYEFLDEATGRRTPGSSSALPEGPLPAEVLLEGNHFAAMFTVWLRGPLANLRFEEDRRYTTAEDWLYLIAAVQRASMYVIDRCTLTMRHHSGRSMGNHAAVIAAREAATQWARANLSYTQAQLASLEGYTAYFSAVHHHLAGDESAARIQLRIARKRIGCKTSFARLWVKTLFSRRVINALKRLK